MRKNYMLLLALVTSGFYAQTSLQVVDNYLKTNITEGQSRIAKFSNLEYKVLNENVVGNNVGDYVKIQQTVNDIPVYQSFGTFQVKNKQVLTFNNNFFVGSPANTTAGLTANQAIEKFASKISKTAKQTNDMDNLAHSPKAKLDAGDVLYSDKEQLLNYYHTKDGLRLAWVLLASYRTNADKELTVPLYELVIDANSGELLAKNSVVNECFVDPLAGSKSIIKNDIKDYDWIYEEYNKTNKLDANTGTYRVIPANFQSPLQHDFTLISNASDPVASKEGWHKLINVARDTQASMPLTKYHTVGNNARVSSDPNGVASDIILNSGGLLAELSLAYLKDEAYGGESLLFDFPNPGASTNYNPFNYLSASTTQMFYSVNSIHDILHYHGFNPKAGSFQANSGEGRLVTGMTTSGLGKTRTVNNAFMIYNSNLFKSPITCFFTFETLKEDAGVLDVNSGIYKGSYKGAVGNNTAYNYGVDPRVTGDMVLLDDGSGANAHDGCEAPINANLFQDKVVLIDRGNCPFSDKVAKVVAYHPKAIVILNNTTAALSGAIGVVNGSNDSQITFPIVTLEQDIANNLKQTLLNATAPTVTLPSIDYGITKRDSGFDSQVILHEYTHAVSGRLTASAMGGEEGMNEGWSDYVAINLTQQANQTGTDQIEMGSYAFGGGGLREKPYTTDMSINPHTYDYLKVIGAGENLQHPTGYLWAVMLWEMHWKFVDKYGFNPDHKSNQGGNNMALDLVLQGQKIQVPNPGFVEGRDAILQADQLMFNGDNKCIIWEAFAKRGLGYSAIQGSSQSRIDGTEAFDLPNACKTLATNEVGNNSLSIYPNPTKDVVYVMAKEELVKAEIFDASGRLISTQVLDANQQKRSIDTSILLKGVFVVKFYTKDGVITKKIIKN